MIDTNHLNANQLEVFEWRDGPLLVLGGSGSGKIEVQSLRIVDILYKQRRHPGILSLSSGTKAINSLKRAVKTLLIGRFIGYRVCTVHTYAMQLLRQHGSHIGIELDFALLTHPEERAIILEKACEKVMGHSRYMQEDYTILLHLIDQLFSESYNPEDSDNHKTWPTWVTDLFVAYCETLEQSNRQDHGSLLHFANRLLKEKTYIRTNAVNITWRQICVSDIHLINQAQYDLLRHLAPNRNNHLLAFADHTQLVYQWNGASQKRLSDLKRDYDLTVTQLPENNHCSPEITCRANRMIIVNSGMQKEMKVVKPVNGSPMSTLKIKYKMLNSSREESEYIAESIYSNNLQAEDCVILARTNQLIQAIAHELQNVGIETFVPQQKIPFDSPILGVMSAALALAASPNDRVMLKTLCRQWNLVSGIIIESQEVETESIFTDDDFLKAWINVVNRIETRENYYVLNLIHQYLHGTFDFLHMLEKFFDHFGHGSNGQHRDEFLSSELEIWQEKHADILDQHGSDLTLNTYMKNFFPSTIGRPTPTSIQCLTVHLAKGLQFKHVYLAGMSQGIFPAVTALYHGVHSDEMERERRSCFVALTSAQESVTLTRSKEYFGTPRDPSQFLDEMGITSTTEDTLPHHSTSLEKEAATA